MTLTGSRHGDLWAITSYFNPMRYRRRLSNFRIFRKHLTVPLIAVELSYSDDYELQDDEADILLQLHGDAVLWQKEQLLNLAIKALPHSCQKVAILDCDIIFRLDDWVEAARTLLDQVPWIQLFKTVHYLSPHSDPTSSTQVEFSRMSSGVALASGVPPTDCLAHLLDRRVGTSSPGHAWAARREILDRHGFYDACIVGGGDRAIISAAYGCFDGLMDRHCMNDPQRQHYLAWAEPLHDSVKANTSFIEGDIVHLWHGDVRNRSPRGRHEGLQRFHFDPFEDIAIQENGSLGWNTDKPEMHDYVRGYFSSRREDG